MNDWFGAVMWGFWATLGICGLGVAVWIVYLTFSMFWPWSLGAALLWFGLSLYFWMTSDGRDEESHP